MPTTPFPAPAFVEDEALAASFEVDDVVALTRDWPEADLEQGVWGAIVTLVGPDRAIVEFTDEAGLATQTREVSLGWLELVWSEPV